MIPPPANSDRSLSAFVTAAFSAWDSAGLRFVVLRNYEELPDHVENDIDILVPHDEYESAVDILINGAGHAGYLLHNRAEFTATCLFFHHRESLRQLQVDLSTSLGVRVLKILPAQDVLDRQVRKRLFAHPDPVDEAIVNLLTRLLYHGYVKEKYRPGIRAAFQTSPEAARERLADAFGLEHARFLVEAASNGHWNRIEARAAALRRSLLWRHLVHQPLQLVRSIFNSAWRLWQRWLRPPGLSIVLLGPDGCGKSTVGAMIVKALRYSFAPDKGLQIHWKPVVFFRKRREGRPPTTDPHGRPPRNLLFSLLFLGYHWVEYLLGTLLQIHPVKFRNGLVLIDRHYYDFLVDPGRYRLNVPAWVIRLGAALLPKPDLIFLLDAPVAVLQSRKQEVPPAETERQRQGFLKLVRGMPNARVIDATRSPEDVTGEITAEILTQMVERTGKRHSKHQAV